MQCRKGTPQFQTLHVIMPDGFRNTSGGARRVILGGKEITRNVSEIEAQLADDPWNAPGTLQIEPDGYEL